MRNPFTASDKAHQAAIAQAVEESIQKATSAKKTKELLADLQNQSAKSLKKNEIEVIKAQAAALMELLVAQQAEVREVKAKKAAAKCQTENEEIENQNDGEATEEEQPNSTSPQTAQEKILGALLKCFPKK